MPAPDYSSGSGDKDNLQDLQLRSNEITDQSLDSTRRMLQLCEESKEAAIRTLVSLDDQGGIEYILSCRPNLKIHGRTQDTGARTLQLLDHQGEQLDHIEEGMDQINVDMKEAEKNLTGMEKCCGICVLPCSRPSEPKDESKAWNKNIDDGKVINNQPARLSDRNGMMTTQSGYISKITNDAREEEMEDNLGQVSSMVGNLRNMAIDMGSEISSQNRQIDRINLKAESNETRISSANERAVKILKN